MKCLEYVPAICEGCERRQSKQQNSHMGLFVTTVLQLVNTQPRDVQQDLNEAKNSGFVLLMLLLMRINEQLIHLSSKKDRIQLLSGTNIYLTSHFLYFSLARFCPLCRKFLLWGHLCLCPDSRCSPSIATRKSAVSVSNNSSSGMYKAEMSL